MSFVLFVSLHTVLASQEAKLVVAKQVFLFYLSISRASIQVEHNLNMEKTKTMRNALKMPTIILKKQERHDDPLIATGANYTPNSNNRKTYR